MGVSNEHERIMNTLGSVYLRELSKSSKMALKNARNSIVSLLPSHTLSGILEFEFIINYGLSD